MKNQMPIKCLCYRKEFTQLNKGKNMKCQTINIKNNIPEVEPIENKDNPYLSKHGETVVYYKLVKSKNNYRKRLSDSIIKEITSMEDSYSKKD